MLVALLSLSSWCLVVVVWLSLAVPWVFLQFVIVVCNFLTILTIFFILSFSSVKETKSATMSIFRKKKIFFLNHL